MFITKSQNLTLTLFVYIALVLSLTVTSEAHIQQRDHVNLKRLIKKRSPFPQGDAPLVPVAGAGAAVPSFPPTSSAASTSTSISATSTSVSQSTVSVSSTSTSSTASSSSSSSVSSSSSSESTSSVASSTTASTTQSTTATLPTSEAINVTGAPESQPSSSQSTKTLTELVGASETTAATNKTLPQSNASKSAKSTTLTVLIAVAASVAGIAIIWTVFRKWKLGRSSKFDERLQPIDWQPTNPDEAIPGNHRRLSGASSFHSGTGHGSAAPRGYGASDHGHGSEPAPSMYAIPDHDFTSVPSTLAPVGGYADLSRGPSPQPQMHQMSRGPSLTRPTYDVGVPLHHQAGYGTQDAYDYSGSQRRY